MARRLWVVLVEDFDHMVPSDYYRNQYYVNTEHDSNRISVFMSENDARSAAAQISQQFPGKDVHVFSPSYGFVSTPRPVETKIWTPDGKYIPGTPE